MQWAIGGQGGWLTVLSANRIPPRRMNHSPSFKKSLSTADCVQIEIVYGVSQSAVRTLFESRDVQKALKGCLITKQFLPDGQ